MKRYHYGGQSMVMFLHTKANMQIKNWQHTLSFHVRMLERTTYQSKSVFTLLNMNDILYAFIVLYKLFTRLRVMSVARAEQIGRNHGTHKYMVGLCLVVRLLPVQTPL